jgi:hypothetical protein
VPLQYASALAPDSVSMVFFPGNTQQVTVGSVLRVDEIAFTGTATRDAALTVAPNPSPDGRYQLSSPQRRPAGRLPHCIRRHRPRGAPLSRHFPGHHHTYPRFERPTRRHLYHGATHPHRHGHAPTNPLKVIFQPLMKRRALLALPLALPVLPGFDLRTLAAPGPTTGVKVDSRPGPVRAELHLPGGALRFQGIGPGHQRRHEPLRHHPFREDCPPCSFVAQATN